MRVLLHASLAVLWDVGRNRCPRRGELPAVPDASNGINRRALLVPDRGNGSTGLLRGVPLTVNPARSSDSLSPGKDQKWDRLLNSREEVLTDRLHCIRFMKKKTANMEVIAENTLRNSYEKRLKKNIKFDSFLYAFWERGDDELLHVQRRMHPEAPESSRKAERLRIKPGDSNIKVMYWFKWIYSNTWKHFLLKGDRCAEESAGIFI